MMSRVDRYAAGGYDVDFGDDVWKAEQMSRLIEPIPDPETIRSYPDVGCGNDGVFASIKGNLSNAGSPIERAVGYDLLPEDSYTAHSQGITFKRMESGADDESFDLVTVSDVVEHVLAPHHFLRVIGERTRYVALPFPFDDRLSVLLTNQDNYRICPIGHISFFNPARAINVITAAGLLPIHVMFTPGSMAPSGVCRFSQRAIFPLRWLMWRINPGLMAVTTGGASLAALCRGSAAASA